MGKKGKSPQPPAVEPQKQNEINHKISADIGGESQSPKVTLGVGERDVTGMVSHYGVPGQCPHVAQGSKRGTCHSHGVTLWRARPMPSCCPRV